VSFNILLCYRNFSEILILLLNTPVESTEILVVFYFILKGTEDILYIRGRAKGNTILKNLQKLAQL
jgi:hypothetical protein